MAAGVAVLALAGAALAGCGGGAKGADTLAHGSGPVDVLYAGSLVNLLEHQIGPAFHTATGYSFSGYAAGSQAVANAIKGKVQVGDVFVSASDKVDKDLEGSANGGWVSWYASFAKARLVIGYNRASRFAADFAGMPWYQVLAMPGIRLGRTDPKLDPKGKLTVTALTAAERIYHLSGFAAKVEHAAAVFPEQELVGRLQAGQLDAGFFYTSEAVPLHIPTVSLGSVHAAATFTITVLNRAPHPAAAAAFVSYLLGSAGQARMRADGLTLLTPKVSGSGVPASLHGVLG